MKPEVWAEHAVGKTCICNQSHNPSADCLQREIQAWQAASDEAWRRLEKESVTPGEHTAVG